MNNLSTFYKVPIYFGRMALVLAYIPLVMLFLCAITRNSFSSLIDLYYTFVTPIQICKWSVVFSFILSALTRLAIGRIYIASNSSYIYKDYYTEANKYYVRAVFLTLLELIVYFLIVIQANN